MPKDVQNLASMSHEPVYKQVAKQGPSVILNGFSGRDPLMLLKQSLWLQGHDKKPSWHKYPIKKKK